MRLQRTLLWATCLVLLSGCGEKLSEPELPADPLAAATVDRPAPGKRPYGCFISVATPNGRFKYRYHEIPFRFARPAVDAADGRYGLFRYRRYARDNSLLWLANCIIPYSDEAIQVATERFAFRPGKRREAHRASLLPLGAVKRAFNLIGAAIVQLGCGTYENPCPIDPVENWCADHPDDPECEEDPNEPVFPELPDDPPGGGPPCYPCLPGGGGSGGGGDGEPTAEATLDCNDGTRGSNVTCEIDVNPATASLQVMRWRFTGAGFEIARNSVAESWSGIGVVTGNVFVYFVLDGDTLFDSDELKIWNRSWSWAGQLDTGHAALGQYDDCMTASQAGLTVGTSCSAQNKGVLFTPGSTLSGYQLDAPRSGPNEGIWFVKSISTAMHLRAQIAKRYRVDGDSFPVNGVQQVVNACAAVFGVPIPPQNNHSVNTQCTQNAGFTGLVNTIWTHEDKHLVAGLAEAQKTLNDLHAKSPLNNKFPISEVSDPGVDGVVALRLDGMGLDVESAHLGLGDANALLVGLVDELRAHLESSGGASG